MKKGLRRWVVWLGIPLLLVVLLLAFLPALASTDRVREAVLSRVSEAAGARIEVAGWSFSWMGSQTLEQVVYEDEKAGLYATLDQLTVERGLWSLWRTRDAGDIVLERPLLRVRLPAPAEPPDVPEPPAPPFPAPRHPAPEERPPPPPPEALPWPAFAGRLLCREGSVVIEEREQSITVGEIEAAIALQRDPAALIIRVTGKQDGAAGSFEVDARLAPDAAGQIGPEGPRAEMAARIADWDLGPLGRFTEAVSGWGLAGEFEVDLRAHMDPVHGGSLDGALSLEDGEMYGSALRGDRPRLGAVHGAWETAWTGDSVEVRRLTLDAPWVSLSAQGGVGPQGVPEGEASGRLDLALLAGWFPNSLALREGLRLDSGEVLFSVRSFASEDGFDVTLDTTIDRVAGTVQERPVALSEPFQWSVEVANLPEEWLVRRAWVRSSFVSMEASGDAREAALTGRLEIAALLAEADQFVDLGAWGAEGALTVDATYRQTGEAGHYLALQLAGEALGLTSDGRVLLADETMNLSLEAAPRIVEDGGMEMDEATLSFAALGCKGRFRVQDLLLYADMQPAAARLSLELDADLERLHEALLHDDSMQLAGSAALRGTILLDGEYMAWDDLHLSLRELFFARDALAYASPAVTLRAEGRAGFGESRSLRIDPFLLEGLPGRIRGHVAAADWAALPAGLSIDVNSSFALDDWLRALDGTQGLEQLAGTRGELEARLEARASPVSAWDVRGDATIASLHVPLPGGEQAFEEERITLQVIAHLDADGGFSFDPFAIDASFLGLSAAGGLAQMAERPWLHCRGTWRYDLEALSRLASAWSGELPLVVAGSAERSFEANLPLDDAWLSDGTAETSFLVERIEGYGLQVGRLEIPMVLKDGVASLSMDTTVNDGRLSVHPRLEQQAAAAVLTLPEPSRVLSEVRLTDAMADELLGLLHPVFKGSAVTGGRVSLTFDRFHAPLGEDHAAALLFNGTLLLEDVELGAGRLLERVRSLARLGEGQYRIGTHTLDFSCADGRIETSPLRLTVDGHPLEISGSMGLDETLDYTVRTPVTERLVGSDLYTVLKGSMITIPVRGTVSRPRLGEQEVREAVSDLVRQAARKSIGSGAERLLRGLIER